MPYDEWPATKIQRLADDAKDMAKKLGAIADIAAGMPGGKIRVQLNTVDRWVPECLRMSEDAETTAKRIKKAHDEGGEIKPRQRGK